MAESSSHHPPSPKITPKEELVTLDKPESPNPFLPADQIEFTFEEIAFTTNNEVALLYPSHPNSEYFREVSDFISKCGIRGDIGYSVEIKAKETLKKSCLPHRWRLLMGQIIQCLGGKIGGLDQISNKDATILYCLANRVVPYLWFISLLLEYIMLEYDNEELTINPTQIFSVHNCALKPNQSKGPPFTNYMKSIYNLDVLVDFKAPKPSSQTKKVSQGKKPRAKSRLKRKKSSKHTSKSKTEASKSKTGQSEEETQSSSAKDKRPSHPSHPIPVVGEMHKEAQQAVGGPTSLRATNEEGAHPQLSSGCDALADSTTKVDPGISAPNDSIPSQQDQTKFTEYGLKTAYTNSCTKEEYRADDILKKIKLEDLSNLLKDTRCALFTPDSLQDKPIIVTDESGEEEEVTKDKDIHTSSHDSRKDELEKQKEKAKAEVASLKARPLYLDINQLINLLVTSLKHALSKLLASHNFASCLPTELKDLPLKFTELSREIKELKQHVNDMEIELPRDLKEIPTKLETFTSTISSLTSQVAELKNIQWELLIEFQALPVLVSSVQKQLKTLDSLPSLFNKVTETLNRFAIVAKNASGSTTKDVPSAGQATASPAEGRKTPPRMLKQTCKMN
uniref:Uncharacterized protein n=1 Tax=Tanacetum cinerariifolium TaxID=118510 RepID=A0A6L2MUX5_TANCI|nr:hypothetical protein [Tanacetum cinerariifolium]